jgi:hypothetical protein
MGISSVDGSARLEKGRKQRKQRGVRNLELIGISRERDHSLRIIQ